MSGAATEIYGEVGKPSPTWEPDISDGDSNKLSNSDFESVASNFSNNSADKTSCLQLANTSSMATYPLSTLNSSDGSKPPASFERWCVDRFPKFYTHAYAYYCLFLSIVNYIVTFMQISWYVFRVSTSVVGTLLSAGTLPADVPSELNPQKRQHLQQPIRTVPRSPPIDLSTLIPRKPCTLSRNDRSIPQTFEQQRYSVAERVASLRLQAIKTQTRTTETMRKDTVPMVCVRRTTSVVEKVVSVGIRPAASFAGSFGHVSIVHARRFTSIVEDFLPVGFRPSSLLSRHNLQKPDGRKGKQSNHQAGNVATRANDMGKGAIEQYRPKHGSKLGEKSSSSKQGQNTVVRRDERRPGASKTETRTCDIRKGAMEQYRPKHSFKPAEKSSLSKQGQNTDLRRDERRPGASKAETRTCDIRKGTIEQYRPKHGSKPGEKSSSKQGQNMGHRREERGPRASNAEARIHYGKKGVKQTTTKHGVTTGQKASSSNPGLSFWPF